MRRAFIIFALLFSATPASSTEWLSKHSYGAGFGDANVLYEGHKLQLRVNPKDDTLSLIPYPFDGSPLGQLSLEDWRSIFVSFVAPTGCGIPTVVKSSPPVAVAEASYLCPPNVDLRAIIKAQHATLIKGQPIRMVDTQGVTSSTSD